jgi:hypothetical protein
MHVTVGTLFLLFCWMRHYLTSALLEDIKENVNVSAILRNILHFLGYRPSKARKWAFLPAHHFGFEAAA